MSGEGAAIAGDPGEEQAVRPLAAIVDLADPVAADDAPAWSGPDPTDLVAPGSEPRAAPMAATVARPAEMLATQPLPPVQLPTPDHRGRSVAARLVIVDGLEGSRVRIDLEPADLGRVEVALRLDDSGAAAASFTVDRPETLQLLQRDARVVSEMLSAAGFTLDQGGLDFTLRDPGGRDGSGEGRRAERRHGDGEFGAGTAPSEPAPQYRRGLLDLEV